jgi:hypothetical protein
MNQTLKDALVWVAVAAAMIGCVVAVLAVAP